MIVRTIHGMGSRVESFEGNMIITNCNVVVEENLIDQLNEIKMINSVIKLPDTTIYTDDQGKFLKVVKDNPKNNGTLESVYKEDGMAIYINGRMVIGIHPDNLINNLENLHTGNMKFDWKTIAKNIGIKIND